MRIVFLFCSALLMCPRASFAMDALSTQFELNIESQRLDRALKEFGRQAKINITIDAIDRAKSFKSPVLKGQISGADAFNRLLADTDLKVEGDEDSFSIKLADSVKQPASAKGVKPVDTTNRPETIVVTGSNMLRNEVKTAAVTTYSSVDLGINLGPISADQLGQRTLQNFQLVNSQTSTAANVNPVAGNNFARGDAFNLLGASPGATLVLFAGHRLAPGGFNGSAVDFSLLPWIALDHLDVMLGGASAIYGSDAVSGVLNFVPRYSFKGAETTLYYGDAKNGGGTSRGLSQIWGREWEGGGFMLAYQRQQQQAVDASLRNTLVPQGGRSDVIPSQLSDSGVLTSKHEFDNKSWLAGDAFYTRRAFDQMYISGPSIPTRSLGRANMWGGSLDADLTISSDWDTRIMGAYVQEVEMVTTSVDTASLPYRTQSTMASFDWMAEGSVLSLDGGPLKVSGGVSGRREAFAVSSGIPGVPEVDSLRNVLSTYAEVSIPFVGVGNSLRWAKQIELSAAWRRDAYFNQEAGIANVSSNNPMVGLLWSPISNVNLRGTYATSFRPAPQYDTAKATDQAELLSLSNPNVPGVSYGTMYITGGNPTLRPELAQSYTIGVDFQSSESPSPSISLTYVHVGYRDRIAAPPVIGDVTAIYSQLDTLRPFLNLNPSEADIGSVYKSYSVYDPSQLGKSAVRAIFDSRLHNIASTEVSGVQLDAKSKIETDMGDFSLRLQGLYLTELSNRAAATTPYVSSLGTDFNPSRVRLQSTSSWEKWGWSASAHMDFTGPYRDTLSVSSTHVPSWLVIDFNVAYTTDGHANLGLLANTTAALSITNVADRPPPTVEGLSNQTLGYDPSHASAMGRFVWFILKKHF